MISRPLPIAEGLAFKNRLVMAPVACNMADADGCVTEAVVAFYEERARGGVGAIIVGATAVTEDGGVTRRTMRLHNARQQRGVARLAEAVRRFCPAGIQLFHAGGQGNPEYTGFSLLAPSPYLHPPIGHQARPMRPSEIRRMVAAFVRSALRALDAGMDFVELHAAHGYLLHEFLSPYFNRRQDAYGGAVERRARFLFEILEGIRAAEPRALSRVGIRFSACDFVANGIDESFYAWLLPRLEGYGLAYYHVTAGVYDSSPEKRRVMEEGGFQDFAAFFKQRSARPILTVGGVRSLAAAEEVLRAGQADGVAMARALIADPALPCKSFAGRAADLRPCSGCNRCHYLAGGRPELPVACRKGAGD